MYFGEEEIWALQLSTFAGLSTAIGGIIAVIKRPDDSLLAFLLGTAIGVMFLLSLVEMWIHNAIENGALAVTIAVLVGALFYQCLQPFLPEMGPVDDSGNNPSTTAVVHDSLKRDHGRRNRLTKEGNLSLKPAELLRLGFLMALTMTLHNLPEGCAVAFSSFTDFGPLMAVAIALHNIPEGVIVAAPVYAATNSRWRAVGLALASGLSEPVGALFALLTMRPYLTEQHLQFVLAFVGGIMMAVCALELWPEARKCRNDQRLLAGIALGASLMGWTLYIGI